MTLRRHQAAMQSLAREIAAGKSITRIHAEVTPGGGKSMLPPILANELIGRGFDSVVWVVPRDSLRYQGEADFSRVSPHPFRAAGNVGDPFRGCRGYVTTYQSIAANPQVHYDALRFEKSAIFLDEPHHVSHGSLWHRSLMPIVEKSKLLVLASGTFARDDGKKIAFYDDESDAATITYSRSMALEDGAILPVEFKYLGGEAEWMDASGETKRAQLSSRDTAADALFTALRTSYALALLDACISDWIETRKSAYPSAKLLVVAPNIHQAGIYSAHLSRRKVHNLIATSDDPDAAAVAIARFKGDQTPGVDALVTVAMAYEGLSVPQISHIACLTHIRSLPWLEQCFARGNRCSPGKKKAVVYGPEDPRFMDAIQAIEREQVAAICARNAKQEREGAGGEGEEGGAGTAKPKITPLSSIAYASEIVIPLAPESMELKGLSHSSAETLLRQQIATHIELFIDAQRPGARHPYQLVITRKLKELVGLKSRSECSVEELTRQWAYLKQHYPLGRGR